MKLILLGIFVMLLMACQQNEVIDDTSKPEQSSDPDYIRLGEHYAQQTQKVLGSHLKAAIQKNGPVGALGFCHEQAIPLTHSVEAGQLLNIKRVSDKNRNPVNVPNEQQLNYIMKAKQQLSVNKTPSTKIDEMPNKVVAYVPIMTQPMCLQCHGSPQTDIAPATLKALKDYYPDDKAIGYGPNQLRGIWVVSMAKTP